MKAGQHSFHGFSINMNVLFEKFVTGVLICPTSTKSTNVSSYYSVKGFNQNIYIISFNITSSNQVPLPHATLLPACESLLCSPRRPISLRQVAPGRSRAYHPEYRLEEQAIVRRRESAVSGLARQQVCGIVLPVSNGLSSAWDAIATVFESTSGAPCPLVVVDDDFFGPRKPTRLAKTELAPLDESPRRDHLPVAGLSTAEQIFHRHEAQETLFLFNELLAVQTRSVDPR